MPCGGEGSSCVRRRCVCGKGWLGARCSFAGFAVLAGRAGGASCNASAECGGAAGECCGREAGTWLHHIVTNYDRLADRTVFLQGDPFDHLLPGVGIERYVNGTEDVFLPLTAVARAERRLRPFAPASGTVTCSQGGAPGSQRGNPCRVCPCSG